MKESSKKLVKTKTLRVAFPDAPFAFETGTKLDHVELAYETYGDLNAGGDNAIFVCHALTGSAHAAFYNAPEERTPGWWDGLIGPGKALDPERYFIVCANLLGSCYGSTGPSTVNPAAGRVYGMNFPTVTTRDMARSQKRLLEALGVKRLRLVIGGSLGGMLTWQWLVDHPDFVEAAIPIAGTVQGSPWMIGLNEVARQAIFNDPAWQDGEYEGKGPEAGLALARMIAMITYRSDRQFWERFARERVRPEPEHELEFDNWFQIESYLHYQGQKLVRRFDARSYVYLTEAMDLHDVSRGYGSLDDALDRIQSEVLVVGIDSDMLYFPHELRATVARLKKLGKKAEYAELHSVYGHDAFLIEYEQLNHIVRDFLERRR